MKPLETYLEEHAHGLNEYLDIVERETHLKVMQPHMLSGKNQAVFLKLLAMSTNAKFIIEIGTFTGYTALAFAEAIPSDGKIITLECDAEIAETAQVHFNNSPYGSKIELKVGEAKTLFETCFEKIMPDLIFIDADKESNLFYYQIAIEKIKSGSLILVDNVLWKHKVLDENIVDKKTKAIKEFNDFVKNDNRVDATILPIRDGIYLIRKK